MDEQDFSGPEWIDDPNQRLIALLHRDAHYGDEALAEMKRIRFRDMVWRPYLQAGSPYGDDEDGARKWDEERWALAVTEPFTAPPPQPYPYDLSISGVGYQLPFLPSGPSFQQYVANLQQQNRAFSVTVTPPDPPPPDLNMSVVVPDFMIADPPPGVDIAHMIRERAVHALARKLAEQIMDGEWDTPMLVQCNTHEERDPNLMQYEYHWRIRQKRP